MHAADRLALHVILFKFKSPAAYMKFYKLINYSSVYTISCFLLPEVAAGAMHPKTERYSGDRRQMPLQTCLTCMEDGTDAAVADSRRRIIIPYDLDVTREY